MFTVANSLTSALVNPANFDIVGVSREITVHDPAWAEVSNFLLGDSSPFELSDKMGYILWVTSESSKKNTASDPQKLLDNNQDYFDLAVYKYAFQHYNAIWLNKIIIPALNVSRAYVKVAENDKISLVKALALNNQVGFDLSLTLINDFAEKHVTEYLQSCTVEKAINFTLYHLQYSFIAEVIPNIVDEIKAWVAVNILGLTATDEELPNAWLIKILMFNESNFKADGNRNL
jgi:hypothetical protein